MEKYFLIFILSIVPAAWAQVLPNYNEFVNAVTSNENFPRPSPEQHRNFNQYAQSVGGISSKQEAAMALAQFLHESGGLTQISEEKCKNTQCKNEYRCSTPGACWVNCDKPDKYYYGRGYIQLSWCYNYRDASQSIFGNQEVLLNDPDRVAREEPLAWQTAFWFWQAKVRNEPGVQQGQFGASTRVINSRECVAGNTEKERRFRFYSNVRRAFGLTGPGDPSGC